MQIGSGNKLGNGHNDVFRRRFCTECFVQDDILCVTAPYKVTQMIPASSQTPLRSSAGSASSKLVNLPFTLQTAQSDTTDKFPRSYSITISTHACLLMLIEGKSSLKSITGSTNLLAWAVNPFSKHVEER